MANTERGLSALETLAETWAIFATLGSLLHFIGYFSLRFHLTTFGIETELAVLDERYLFAGARFLVYLVAAVPTLVMLILLAAAVLWLAYRVHPSAARERIRAFFANHWKTTWAQRPGRLALAGVVLSVALIQLVMRQCFFLSNLLVREALPGPVWLQSILLDSDGLQSLFFSGLLAGIGMSGGLLLLAMQSEAQTTWSRLMVGLLGFLVAVQFLLLPVNHGVLIAEKMVPKITNLSELDSVEGERQMWLVWQGNEWVTVLVQNRDVTGERRTMITLPRNEVSHRIKTIQFDPILPLLFGEPRLHPGR